MMRIEIEPLALAQLEQIYAYSVNQWGRDQAAAYSDALYDAIDAIGLGAFPWRRVHTSFGVDGYMRKCGSHLIYWRHGADDVVRVVAILHERMHQSSRLRDVLDGAP